MLLALERLSTAAHPGERGLWCSPQHLLKRRKGRVGGEGSRDRRGRREHGSPVTTLPRVIVPSSLMTGRAAHTQEHIQQAWLAALGFREHGVAQH